MGATLEEAQLLQKKHDLSTEAFLHVLDCIRRYSHIRKL